MEFNSYLFTLCFLPCVIILYYLLQKLKQPKLAKSLLFVSSLYFVGYAGVKNIFFLMLSIIVNFSLAILLKKKSDSIFVSKLLVAVGVIFNLAILSYTKYSYFIADNLEKRMGIHWELSDIFVPLGISFVNFFIVIFSLIFSEIYSGTYC